MRRHAYADVQNTMWIPLPISYLYGEVGLRRAVPLAVGLTSVSNPKLQILETLSGGGGVRVLRLTNS